MGTELQVDATASGDGGRIYLVRHGETEWNRVGRWQGVTDIPLSDVGRAQARALGETLAGHGIDRVYSSHLTRARETAEIVTATWELAPPIQIDPRLRERGYGSFEGLTREECAARFPGAWDLYLADRRVVPPDAEPQAEVVERASAALGTIAAGLRPGARSLVVSHGGTIRSFVHHAVGIVLPPLGNGAIVSLGWKDDRFVLLGPSE